jgi:hypothetical protein
MLLKICLLLVVAVVPSQGMMDIQRINSSTTVNDDFMGFEQKHSDDKKIVYNYFTTKQTIKTLFVSINDQ